MPKTRPLTISQQRKETNAKANQSFRVFMTVYKLETKKTDKQIADQLGVGKMKPFYIRKDPGNSNLDEVRTLMHLMGATPEDWLRLGGFKT